MVPKDHLPPNPVICMVRQKCHMVQHYHGRRSPLYLYGYGNKTDENALDNQFVITHVKCS